MRNHLFMAVAAMLVAAGCATRSAPELEPLPVASLRSAPGGAGDSLRTFFDSLGAAQRSTESRAPLTLAGDTSAAVAWIDLLQDSALVALVRDALKNNRDLAIARSRIKEFRAQLGVERAGLLPEVSANGSAAKQQVVFGSLGALGFDAWRVTADLSWELDFWGRIRGNVAAAGFDLDAQDENVRATVLSLVGDVATAYLQLRALDQNIVVAERTLASRRETLRLAQRRFAQGLISELDVRQFEALVAAPAAQLAQLRLAVARTEHQLSQLAGRGPGPIARGRPLAEVARSVTVPDSVSSRLIAHRPDVLGAEHQVAAAAARAGSARAARLPKFTITGQYGTQSEQPSKLFGSNTSIYTIQGGVSIPILDWGKRHNDERAADAREEQAQFNYEQTVLTALREVSDALVGVRSTHDQLLAQQVQVRALRRALELAQRRYQGGISSSLEVLDAERSLFSAELAATAAEQAYLTSAVQLYRALGGSWAAP